MKIRVFSAVFLPVHLYGATALALTRTEERTLDAFEIGMLKTIAGVR